MKKYLIITILFAFGFQVALAQRIQGIVKSNTGEVLPFATIWVENLNKGTIANENGQYQFSLGAGEHRVVFRYLGYEPKTILVKLTSGDTEKELNISLKEQVVTLQDVKVGGLKEDPAIGIIRRMISMAPYHLKELKSYSAKAYIKGSGKIKSLSKVLEWTVGKKMEKDAGIKVGSIYMLEGVNQLTYQKPNRIQERVISNRNNLPGPLRESAVNLRVAQTNFYRPKVWGSLISPIAPNAFSFYNFSYLGSFKVNDQTISKIQVRPKVVSDDTFEGVLNVVEDTWSIYSFELRFKDANTNSTFRQQNAQFYGVWMPVQYEVKSNVDIMGIGASFDYVTQIKEYTIKVDPAFVVKPQIIEERLEKDLAKEIDQKKIRNVDEAKKAVSGEITRKKLKKALKQIEKEEKKENLDVKQSIYESEYDFEVDSLAKAKPESFWEKERDIPLTEQEVKAYHEADSIYAAGAEKRRKDSINNLPRFKFLQLISGKTYDYSKKGIGVTFQISGLKYDFNAINGNILGYQLDWTNRFSSQNYQKWQLKLQWPSKPSTLYGALDFQRTFQNGRQIFGFQVSNELSQVNGNNPISNALNSFYTVLFNRNYARFYQKQSLGLNYRNRISPKILLLFEGEYRNRMAIENGYTQGLFKNNLFFRPNLIENKDLGQFSTSPDHQVFVKAGIRWQPQALLRRFNKSVYLSNSRGLIFQLDYGQGMVENPFKFLELSVTNRLDLNRLGTLNYQLKGKFFLQKPTNFIDFTHFNGNEINFISTNSTNEFSYRVLPYYLYSTDGASIRGNFSWEPRKLLLSRVTPLYLYGIRESLHYNAIYLPNRVDSKYYQEISYRLNGIFGMFGLEVVRPIGNWIPEQTKVLISVPF